MEWTEAHDYLQVVMKRELETMRQILENMHLEEQFILKNEKKYWGSMMKEREQLLKELTTIRQDRIEAMDKLKIAVHCTGSSLEELLPSQSTNSWEILLLQDQMANLTDRMNLQTSRNAMLMQIAHAPMPAPALKKKIFIATLPEEEYREKNG